MADNTAVYEGLFILDSNKFARDRDNLARELEGLVEAVDGEMLVSRLWEERRLAYPIDGHRKGAYWLTYFKVDSNQITNLTRQCQLSDSIIRTLFLKVDPRIVDVLVSHALAGPASLRKPPEPIAVTVPAIEEDVVDALGD